MNLQPFFHDTVREVVELSPGYDNHASDVWLVKTDKEEVIVRSSRMKEEPHNDFWWGCKRLFGIDPREVHNLQFVNNRLREISSIPIPKVVHKWEIERQYIAVEKLDGSMITSFIGQPSSLLQSLGEGLARIHQVQCDYVGNAKGTFKVNLEQFHEHLIHGMTEIVEKFHFHNDKLKQKLPEMIEKVKKLQTPQSSTFVLVDMDPTQFLSNGSIITGLVDTEAYVIAPREFDFIGLEYLLDEEAVTEFKRGYKRVMELPSLELCREPYRYLYRLLAVQGRVDVEEWLNFKKLF